MDTKKSRIKTVISDNKSKIIAIGVFIVVMIILFVFVVPLVCPCSCYDLWGTCGITCTGNQTYDSDTQSCRSSYNNTEIISNCSTNEKMDLLTKRCVCIDGYTRNASGVCLVKTNEPKPSNDPVIMFKSNIN